MVRPSEVEDCINTTINAWQTLAPGKSFGGMTLAQFVNKISPSVADRDTLNGLQYQVTAAIVQRNMDDIESMAAVQAMVKGVIANPTEGDNRALYKAMGYIPKSERKSGLPRKTVTPPTPPGLQLLDKAA